MAVAPIPAGYPSVTPYLILDNAKAALDFYGKAFGATERMRLAMPNDKIGHAEIAIGDSVIMLADECAEMQRPSAKKLGASPVGIHLYVTDVDAVYAQALAAGATATHPIEDKFYGDRAGTVTDPFGYEWYIATHVEDVSPEEIHRRLEKMGASVADKT